MLPSFSVRPRYRWALIAAVFGASIGLVQAPALLAQQAPLTDIDGVPLCTDHDPLVWHPLVKRDANGSIVCTYGHDHGADPHSVDSVFGPLNQVIPGGQEIAYPWVTSDTENSTDPSSLSHVPADARQVLNGKHAFFKWETLTPSKLAAAGINGCPPNSNAIFGFDNIRMEVHADANAGADIRFHSFFVQAQECSTTDPSYHGQIAVGGHFDYGILNGSHKGDGHELDVRIPLPDVDPCAPNSILANGTACPYLASRRIHGASAAGPSNSADPNSGLPGAVRGDFTWYGHNGDPDLAGQVTTGLGLDVSDGIREQDWGPVNPNDPHGPVLFYGPGYDHGWGGIDIFDFMAPQPARFASDNPATLNADGTYNWNGWVDVHGLVQPAALCQGQTVNAGSTCIPVSIKNMRPGEAQFSNDVSHVPHDTYDVADANGVSLIGYPN
jgi:hypothetical protein